MLASMAILQVARMGHPILRKKARALDPCEIKKAAIQQLIDDMVETLIEYHGAGLAAPQVHVGLRLFLALPGEDSREPTILLNPEIRTIGSEVVEDWEGCLSIPDIRGVVPRAREIAVRALDRHGERIEFKTADFPARVIQHEYDHIEGILFLDRMRSLESLAFVLPSGSIAPPF